MKCSICSNRINKKKDYYVCAGRYRYCKRCSNFVFRFANSVSQIVNSKSFKEVQ